MKAVALTFALWGAAARAQAPGSEGALAFVIAPPLVVSVGFDVLFVVRLLSDESPGRGTTITAMVFAGLGTLISGIFLLMRLTGRLTSALTTGLTAGGLTVGAGSTVLAIYSFMRRPPDPEPAPLPPPPPREFFVPVVPRDRPPAPQLFGGMR